MIMDIFLGYIWDVAPIGAGLLIFITLRYTKLVRRKISIECNIPQFEERRIFDNLLAEGGPRGFESNVTEHEDTFRDRVLDLLIVNGTYYPNDPDNLNKAAMKLGIIGVEGYGIILKRLKKIKGKRICILQRDLTYFKNVLLEFNELSGIIIAYCLQDKLEILEM